jgi:hypothetical protein
MNRDLDEHINSYAASTEYQFILDAEEEVLDNETEAGEAVEC